LGKDEISPDRPLEIMLISARKIPGQRQEKTMVKYCCYIWTYAQTSSILTKVRVCQLPIEHVNDKSLVTQEEIDFALCCRQGPVTLYPLK
jgi:hypothetical protein